MKAFLTQTINKGRLDYWLIEPTDIVDDAMLIHVLYCSSGLWAQEQTQNTLLDIYDYEADDPHTSRGENIGYHHFFSIEVRGEEAYFLRSSRNGVESDFVLNFPSQLNEMPALVEYALEIATARQMFFRASYPN